MRVIAGIKKGLKLKAPEGENTRPTTDRVKESIFNIIQSYLPVGRVLDLFAGSGAMGIEALSRRCNHCTFVEFSKSAYSLVEHNLNLAKFFDNASLVFSDSLKFLDTKPLPYDLIILDPPYNKGFLTPVLDLIDKNNLLTQGGVIVAETEKNGELPTHPSFMTIKTATYGKTVVTILKRGDTL